MFQLVYNIPLAIAKVQVTYWSVYWVFHIYELIDIIMSTQAVIDIKQSFEDNTFLFVLMSLLFHSNLLSALFCIVIIDFGIAKLYPMLMFFDDIIEGGWIIDTLSFFYDSHYGYRGGRYPGLIEMIGE